MILSSVQYSDGYRAGIPLLINSLFRRIIDDKGNERKKKSKNGGDVLSKISHFFDVMNRVLLDAFVKLTKMMVRCALSLDRLAAALAASLMLSYFYQLSRHGEYSSLEEYYNNIDMAIFIVIAALMFAALIVTTVLTKIRYIIPWALMLLTVAVTFLFALNYPGGSDTVYFALGVGIMDLTVILWEVRGDKLGISEISISRRAALIAAAMMFVAVTITIGYFTSRKYVNYTVFTFDFGIFSQMFERMAVTGLPYTTVERSYMMLHYGVHFSPFFYIFLPGYYIFRSPMYLFYIQAAGIAAGVFAVWLLAGKLGLSGKLTLALEGLYLLYPCLFNGAFYDFHENKFLTAIILFLFYFIVGKKPVGIFLMSLLLLSVKEDAAIYLMVIAVYVMINRKEIFTGAIMLLMAIIYFSIAQQLVASYGHEGVMMDRLSAYFINGEQTFGSVIKAVIFDLGYAIRQMFTGEKFAFVLWMFAPVLFAPFMTKKISSLILLLPIFPINLMQTRSQQYDVYYQYTYGVAALIIVSAIFVITKLSTERRRAVLMTALCICMAMTVLLIAPKVKENDRIYDAYKDQIAKVDEVLDSIPDDATVTAQDSIVPHLYRIKWLFTVPDYTPENWVENPINPGQADYVVIDTRSWNYMKEQAQKLRDLIGNNYVCIRSEGFVELYERKVKVEVIE